MAKAAQNVGNIGQTPEVRTDRNGCEIIAETVDFLSRSKSAENENPELVDRDNEGPLLRTGPPPRTQRLSPPGSGASLRSDTPPLQPVISIAGPPQKSKDGK
jgi:hypothetical protein